jgi:uncharacterized membrane protein (DUF106 family)
MVEHWNFVSLWIGDFLLGWLLQLPSDLVLLALALITAGMMALVRPLTTNQDMLRRIDQDRGRLKQLARQAKRAGNREALLRHRTTGNLLSLRKLGAEFKPLLAVIVPVAVLATWAMYRVEFHPPVEDEPIQVVAYFTATPMTNPAPNWVAPASAEGLDMHIIPRTGLDVIDGGVERTWVRRIGIEKTEASDWDKLWARLTFSEAKSPEPDATAGWLLKGKARRHPYSLYFRFKGQTVQREFLVGQTTYSPSWGIEEKDPFITHIKMREVKLFDTVPGIGAFLPAWLVGYLIIVFPLVFAVKWLLRIY